MSDVFQKLIRAVILETKRIQLKVRNGEIFDMLFLCGDKYTEKFSFLNFHDSL